MMRKTTRVRSMPFSLLVIYWFLWIIINWLSWIGTDGSVRFKTKGDSFANIRVSRVSHLPAGKTIKNSNRQIRQLYAYVANESTPSHGVLKMKKWSSQWTQFMQLRKEAWKKFRTSTGFEPVTSRYRCDALPTELWSHWRWEQVNCQFFFFFFSIVHLSWGKWKFCFIKCFIYHATITTTKSE